MWLQPPGGAQCCRSVIGSVPPSSFLLPVPRRTQSSLAVMPGHGLAHGFKFLSFSWVSPHKKETVCQVAVPDSSLTHALPGSQPLLLLQRGMSPKALAGLQDHCSGMIPLSGCRSSFNLSSSSFCRYSVFSRKNQVRCSWLHRIIIEIGRLLPVRVIPLPIKETLLRASQRPL